MNNLFRPNRSVRYPKKIAPPSASGIGRAGAGNTQLDKSWALPTAPTIRQNTSPLRWPSSVLANLASIGRKLICDLFIFDDIGSNLSDRLPC